MRYDSSYFSRSMQREHPNSPSILRVMLGRVPRLILLAYMPSTSASFSLRYFSSPSLASASSMSLSQWVCLSAANYFLRDYSSILVLSCSFITVLNSYIRQYQKLLGYEYIQAASRRDLCQQGRELSQERLFQVVLLGVREVVLKHPKYRLPVRRQNLWVVACQEENGLERTRLLFLVALKWQHLDEIVHEDLERHGWVDGVDDPTNGCHCVVATGLLGSSVVEYLLEQQKTVLEVLAEVSRCFFEHFCKAVGHVAVDFGFPKRHQCGERLKKFLSMVRSIARRPLKALRQAACHLDVVVDFLSLLKVLQHVWIQIDKNLRSSLRVGSNPVRKLSARVGIRSQRASKVCTSVQSSSPAQPYSYQSSWSTSASSNFLIPSARGVMLRSMKAGPKSFTRSSMLSTAAPLTLLSSSSLMIVSRRGTITVLKCSSKG